ncbi:hypothetical protein PENSPDRAFT_680296 [Peniophora sp. CONT]|nr:hypothetical protein PENSPDRAFT_680296 [Peniophora sp. CONT]
MNVLSGHEDFDPGIETARLVWDAWQSYALRCSFTFSVIPISFLPVNDLPPYKMGIYARDRNVRDIVSSVHLVFPSGRQVCHFAASDIVSPEFLDPQSDRHPSRGSGQILAHPLVVHGLHAHQLLTQACRQAGDNEAWRALCSYVNSPDCEPVPVPISAIWMVDVVYEHAGPGVIVEHIQGEGSRSYRHYAKLLQPFMRTGSRIIFYGQILGSEEIPRCFVVVPTHLVKQSVLEAGVPSYDRQELAIEYDALLLQDEFAPAEDFLSVSVCVLPMTMHEEQSAKEDKVNLHRRASVLRRVFACVFAALRLPRRRVKGPLVVRTVREVTVTGATEIDTDLVVDDCDTMLDVV